MAKSKKKRKNKPAPNRSVGTQPRSKETQEDQSRQFNWIPTWGWILIFLVPLAISEFMFYTAGRKVSMILFPIAWIGFWITLMHRSGWPIVKKQKQEHAKKKEE